MMNTTRSSNSCSNNRINSFSSCIRYISSSSNNSTGIIRSSFISCSSLTATAPLALSHAPVIPFFFLFPGRNAGASRRHATTPRYAPYPPLPTPPPRCVHCQHRRRMAGVVSAPLTFLAPPTPHPPTPLPHRSAPRSRGKFMGRRVNPAEVILGRGGWFLL